MRALIYFLVVSFFTTVLQAQGTVLPAIKQAYQIDPKGSFLPINQIQPDNPPWDVPPNPATTVGITQFSAGSLIKVLRLGGPSLGYYWPDDGPFYSTMAVFTNAAGTHLQAGPKTNAWPFGSVHFCPTYAGTGIFDFPFDFNIIGDNILNNEKGFILEVPQNATQLLVAPGDCPVQDNSDPNNNYKVQITYPVVEKIDYYQVVKNPILQLPSTVVDLVAGKNADMVVKTAPNTNVEGSYVEWKSADGSITKTFQLKPGQIASTASGDVTFYIDPVPKEPAFINTLTKPTVHLRGRDAAGQIVETDKTDEWLGPVGIRKTKPIKIGYIPIGGCNDIIVCYPGTTVADATAMAQYGGEFMKAMYPVADDEFESPMVGQPQSIFERYDTSKNDEKVIINDLSTLEKGRLKSSSQLVSSLTDYTVGIVDMNYFQEKSWVAAGVTTILNRVPSSSYRPAVIVVKDYFVPLAHEFGHQFGLQDLKTTPFENKGYLNYSLSSSWDISRGPLDNKEILMGQPIYPMENYKRFTNRRWISESEYLTIFKENINWNLKIKNFGTLIRFSGLFSSNGIDLVSSFTHSGQQEGLLSNGDYIVKITDIKGNIVSYGQFSANKLSESGRDTFQFSINKPMNAMIANIFKKQGNIEVLLKKIVIPVAIIRDAVSSVDKRYIIGDISLFEKKINVLLNDFSKNLLAGQLSDAIKKLTQEIIPFLENNLTTTITKKDVSFLSNLDEIRKTNFESLAILVGSSATPQSPKNPFVGISLQNSSQQGQRSLLAINPGALPSSPSWMYVYKAFFDGAENRVTASGKSYSAESVLLTQGWHQWLVKTYMVAKKLYNSFQASINQYESDIFKLTRELNLETDPVKKQSIQLKISSLEGMMGKMRFEQFNQMKEVGSHVFVNFEVL